MVSVRCKVQISKGLNNHKSASDWTKFENPVIDFFRAPITYISPAFSLARGYYLNFVKPAGESIMKRKGTKYLYDIGVAGALNQTLGKIEESRILNDEERSRLELHILIPGRLEYCRLALVLQMFINQHEAGKAFSQRIRVLRYDPEHPSNELLWFHNLVVGPQRMT